MSTDEDIELDTIENELETEVVYDNENEVQADDEGNEEQKDKDKKIVKPKRVIRNPQVKLNDATLRSAKGLTAIQGYFDKMKFKGKGYEDQDLNVLMKTYEYWCHRMFPKYPFDACIEKLEVLGSKRATQTYMKRIRMDLIMDENKLQEDKRDDEIPIGDFVDSVDTDNSQFSQLLSSASNTVPKPIQFTEEQLERMRQNKERAERLRQERMQRIREKASNNLEGSSFLASSSGLTSQSTTESPKTSDINSYDVEVNTILNEINVSDDDISSFKENTNVERDVSSNNSDNEEITAIIQNRRNKHLVIDDDEEENSDRCNVDDNEIFASKMQNRKNYHLVIDDDDEEGNSNGSNLDAKSGNVEVVEENCIESMLNSINDDRNSVERDDCETNIEIGAKNARLKSVAKIDDEFPQKNNFTESTEMEDKVSEDRMVV